MPSWEIVAHIKPAASVADLVAIVGREPDDTRRGAMWLAKDVGEANRIFIRLADSRLCINVERYKRKVNFAAKGLMS